MSGHWSGFIFICHKNFSWSITSCANMQQMLSFLQLLFFQSWFIWLLSISSTNVVVHFKFKGNYLNVSLNRFMMICNKIIILLIFQHIIHGVTRVWTYNNKILIPYYSQDLITSVDWKYYIQEIPIRKVQQSDTKNIYATIKCELMSTHVYYFHV